MQASIYIHLHKHLKEIHVEKPHLDQTCFESAKWRSRFQNGVKDVDKRGMKRLEQKRAIRHRDVTPLLLNLNLCVNSGTVIANRG